MRDDVLFVNVTKQDSSFEAFENLLPMDFDGENSAWNLLGVCNQSGQALGVLGYVEDTFSCELKWIYVEQECRRQGIGAALLQEFMDSHLDAYGLKDIYFQLATPYIPEGVYLEEYALDLEYVSTELNNFFIDDGRFDKEIVAQNYIIPAKSRMESPMLQKLMKAPEDETVLPLFEQTPRFLKDSFAFISEEMGYRVNDPQEWESGLLKDLCFCTMDKNENMTGLILLHEGGDKELEISFMYAQNPVNMGKMLAKVLKKAGSAYDDYQISIAAASADAEKLVNHIFGNRRPDYVTCEFHWNFTTPFMEA